MAHGGPRGHAGRVPVLHLHPLDRPASAESTAADGGAGSSIEWLTLRRAAGRCRPARSKRRLRGMEPVLEIIDLCKTYGFVVAVDGISLRVKRGEVFGVLGPNGAGKTTTVECAAGLRRPDSGTVRVLGLDPVTDPDAVRQRVGVQLQHAVLPNRMKVREAMAVFASAYRRHADPDALLAEWGLADRRGTAFAALSGGQKQRLFIALALLGDPEVVVL